MSTFLDSLEKEDISRSMQDSMILWIMSRNPWSSHNGHMVLALKCLKDHKGDHRPGIHSSLAWSVSFP